MLAIINLFLISRRLTIKSFQLFLPPLPQILILLLQKHLNHFPLFLTEPILLRHFIGRFMCHGDIQICFRHSSFCPHRIPIPVIAFSHNRFLFAFRPRRYAGHLPKNIFEKLPLALVHSDNLLIASKRIL